MGKLQIRTEQRDKRDSLMNSTIKKVKNKSGIVELRPITCPECSEEYCNGRTCMEFNYDLYTRIIPKDVTTKVLTKAVSDHQASGASKSVKKKSKSFDFGKSKAKKRNRSKSPTKSKRK